MLYLKGTWADKQYMDAPESPHPGASPGCPHHHANAKPLKTSSQELEAMRALHTVAARFGMPVARVSGSVTERVSWADRS
jgi:hypothetical protein